MKSAIRCAAAAMMALASLPLSAQNAEAATIERERIKLRCPHKGIKRVWRYTVTSADVPVAFDGKRLAFVTDIHYASKFDDRALASLGNALRELSPDMILLGGDYQEGCEYVEPLFSTIMQCRPRLGAAAVMGNNDYERCTDTITQSLARNGIRKLEGDTMQVNIGASQIIIAGARNTFARRETEPSPTLKLKDSDFVILLTHTPDYAEDTDITNTDIALAGHTHGGQVTLFGLYAPIVPSHYGQRFAKGLRRNSMGIPMIISNGLGTSRKRIRMFAPSDIIVLELKNKKR